MRRRARPRSRAEEGEWTVKDPLDEDWGGLRSRIEQTGLSPSLGLIADFSWPLEGGIRERRSDRFFFTAALEVDLERIAGLPGSKVFAEAYSLAGRDASMDVGEVQVFSNIDGPNLAQLAELWFEQTTADERLRVKVGKLDANNEYAAPRAGLGFVHSSAGFSPTVVAFPSYPDPAVSLNVFVRPLDGWELGVGVFNARDGGAVSGRRGMSADFDEQFVVAELERRWSGAEGRLLLGAWHHTGDFGRFDGRTDAGTEGFFAIAEQRLVRWNRDDPDDVRGLRGFLQWGSADEQLSEIVEHLAVGLVANGLVPGRDTWETGLYASRVALSDVPAAGLGGAELAIELYQEIRLTPAVTLKPDFQLIVDPGGSSAIDDAWVATLRVEVSL